MDIKQKASLFAILSASVLASSKFVVGLMSGSMAVVSSGLDSLLDIFMSIMNLFAIRKAAKPADSDHHYGHGKAEDLAAVVQSIVIILSGLIIIYRAVDTFLEGQAITYSYFDLPVMCFSLCVSFAISAVLSRIGRKTGSNALQADALHYLSDLYSNSGAILAIILTFYTGKTFFDLAFAVIIGLIILVSALKILKRGVSGLMDASIPDQIEKEIEAILLNKPYPFAGYHKMRTRFSGNRKYIDFHLLLCRKLSIDEAHQLADEVEQEIEKNVSSIDVVVHVEPCEHACELTESTCEVLSLRAARRQL
jgi:cation diffusion facilitator family transporter